MEVQNPLTFLYGFPCVGFEKATLLSPEVHGQPDTVERSPQHPMPLMPFDEQVVACLHLRDRAIPPTPGPLRHA